MDKTEVQESAERDEIRELYARLRGGQRLQGSPLGLVDERSEQAKSEERVAVRAVCEDEQPLVPEVAGEVVDRLPGRSVGDVCVVQEDDDGRFVRPASSG